MPQLDLTGFLTQIFWSSLVLLLLFLVIYGFVIPEILKTVRIRGRILKDITTNIGKKDISKIDTKYYQLVIELVKTNDNKNSLIKEYTDKSDQSDIDINNKYNKIKLLRLVNAIKLQKFGFTTIFASLIAPTDEFILLICFLIFSILFSYSASSIIENILNNQIHEINDKFRNLMDLQKQNNELTISNINKIVKLNSDKKAVSTFVISSLQQYSEIANKEYNKIIFSSNNKNNQDGLNMNVIKALQRSLRLYFTGKSTRHIKPFSFEDRENILLTDNNATNKMILEIIYKNSPTISTKAIWK